MCEHHCLTHCFGFVFFFPHYLKRDHHHLLRMTGDDRYWNTEISSSFQFHIKLLDWMSKIRGLVYCISSVYVTRLEFQLPLKQAWQDFYWNLAWWWAVNASHYSYPNLENVFYTLGTLRQLYNRHLNFQKILSFPGLLEKHIPKQYNIFLAIQRHQHNLLFWGTGKAETIGKRHWINSLNLWHYIPWKSSPGLTSM